MRAVNFFRLTMASDQHVHCVAGGGKSVSNGGKRFLQTEEKARLLLNLAIHFEVLELSKCKVRLLRGQRGSGGQ